MSEKVLQAEIGLTKPTWLDQIWYDQNVRELQSAALDAVLFNDGVNSDLPKSEL